MELPNLRKPVLMLKRNASEFFMKNSFQSDTIQDMKLLLVEDNKKLADNLKQGLVQEGYVVDIIEDGALAERRILVNSNEYDVVILDLLLPSMDGIEVCTSWRKSGITIPVIMLTALDSVSDKVSGLGAGADDYLVKPFAFEELLARIHALLRRPTQLSPDIVSCGDLSMDTTKREVMYKNKTLPLTLKEFMVLEYLMRHPGKVITRDTLYSHAWDYADSSFSNTVDVHIKNLRRKINDNGKYIQTIRGVGYKMEG